MKTKALKIIISTLAATTIVGTTATTAISAVSNTTASAQTYTVQKGDSLWKIAKNQLGSGLRYKQIFDANRNILKNPNQIQIGQVLQIPENATQTSITNKNIIPSNYTSFETAMSSGIPTFISLLNNLSVGEIKETRIEDLKNTIQKLSNDLVAVQSEPGENSTNRLITSFMYKHGNGYQMVQYLTKRSNNETTYLVTNTSADGKNVTPVYISTNDNNTPFTSIDMSDLLKGSEGKINITTTKNADGTTTKNQQILDKNGNIVTNTVTTVSRTAEHKNVDSVVTQNGNVIANINFYTTYHADGTRTHNTTVTDSVAKSTLTFNTVGNDIDIKSAKIVGTADTIAVTENANVTTDNANLPTFAEYINSTTADLIERLNTMSVGQNVKVSEQNNITYDITKSAENVIVSNVTLPENAINSNFFQILYKCGDGYQTVMYVTRRSDNTKTYMAENVSADGKTFTPIYFSTKPSVQTIGTVTYNGDEILANLGGKIVHETISNENNMLVSKQTNYDKDGNLLNTNRVLTTVKDNISATNVSTTNPDGSITRADFTTTTLDGNRDVRTINITDADKSGILTFETLNGVIVPTSATYEQYGAEKIYEEIGQERVTYFTFPVGTTTIKLSGVETFVKKLDQNSIFLNTKYQNDIYDDMIYMRHGKGYMSLSRSQNDAGDVGMSFELYNEQGKVLGRIFTFATSDDLLKNATTGITGGAPSAMRPNLDVKRTKNADNSTTLEVTTLNNSGQIINKSVSIISADNKKITSTNTVNGEPYTLTFVDSGNNNITLTVDSDHGDAIIKYAVVNGKIDKDSVSVEFDFSEMQAQKA